LIGQGESQLVQQKLLFRGGLRVAWHHQTSTIGGGKSDVQHLDGRERFQHCPRRQSWRQSLQPVLQCHQQTIGKERYQNVRFHAMAQLMIDRTQAQIRRKRGG
jgi:hypothetical protein